MGWRSILFIHHSQNLLVHTRRQRRVLVISRFLSVLYEWERLELPALLFPFLCQPSSLYSRWDHQLMQLLDWPLSLLCFYWFQPGTETDRKKGPFQEEVKWSSSGWRVAFTTLLTRWKNVTIMEALAADSELIGWVPPGQSGARSPCSQTRANKRAEESAWTGGEVSLYQASL